MHVSGSQRPFNGNVAEFVRRADDLSTSDTATGKPHRIACGRVIPAPVVTGSGAFDGGRASKFAAPDNEC